MTQGAPRSAATLGRLTASRSGAVIAVHNAAKRPSQRRKAAISTPRSGHRSVQSYRILSRGPKARHSLCRGRQAPVECSVRTPPGPKGRHRPDCVGASGLIVVDSPAHRWLAPAAEVVPGLRP